MTCNLDNNKPQNCMCQTFFIIDVCSHMQQVAIIFLLYDTAGPTIHCALFGCCCCVLKWEPPGL